MKAFRGILNRSSNLPKDSYLSLDDGFQELCDNLITPVSLSIVRWKGQSKPFLPTSEENYTGWKDVELKFKSFGDFSGKGWSTYKKKDHKMEIKDGSIKHIGDVKEEEPSTPNFKMSISNRQKSKKVQSFRSPSAKNNTEPVSYVYSVKFTKYYTENFSGVESVHDGELTLNKSIRTMYMKGVFEVKRFQGCLYGGHFQIEAEIPNISEIFVALQWEGVVILKKKKIPVKVRRGKDKKLKEFSKHKPPESKEEDPKDPDPRMTKVNVSLLAGDFELDFSGAVSDDPSRAENIQLSCNSSRNKNVEMFVGMVNEGNVSVCWSRRQWDFSEVALQLWISDKYSRYRIELNGKYVETP